MRCNDWAKRQPSSPTTATSNRRPNPPRQQPPPQQYANHQSRRGQFRGQPQPQYRNRWNNNRNAYQRANNGQSHHQSRRQHNRTKSTKPSVEFVADVTVPDRSHHVSGQVLTKTWAMRNSGEFAWGDGVELANLRGAMAWR